MMNTLMQQLRKEINQYSLLYAEPVITKVRAKLLIRVYLWGARCPLKRLPRGTQACRVVKSLLNETR
jgi:hypothetical protein